MPYPVPEGLTPTLADVVNVIPSRAGNSTGDLETTFTDQTSPTAAQVQTLLTQVSAAVRIAAGGTIPTAVAELYRLTVATEVASLVELAYPTVVGENTAQQLHDRYTDLLKELKAAVRALAAGQDTSGEQPLSPAWSFPAPTDSYGRSLVTTPYTGL